jgi:hypothetical protein
LIQRVGCCSGVSTATKEIAEARMTANPVDGIRYMGARFFKCDLQMQTHMDPNQLARSDIRQVRR